jgi:hypothetical protein
MRDGGPEAWASADDEQAVAGVRCHTATVGRAVMLTHGNAQEDFAEREVTEIPEHDASTTC